MRTTAGRFPRVNVAVLAAALARWGEARVQARASGITPVPVSGPVAVAGSDSTAQGSGACAVAGAMRGYLVIDLR